MQELPQSCIEMRGGMQVLCTPKAFHPIAQRRERSERTLGLAGRFSGTPTGFHPNGPDARYGTPLGYLMKSIPPPSVRSPGLATLGYRMKRLRRSDARRVSRVHHDRQCRNPLLRPSSSSPSFENDREIVILANRCDDLRVTFPDQTERSESLTFRFGRMIR